MSNEMKDWQADEIQELRVKVKELEAELSQVAGRGKATRYDCTIGPEGTPEMDPFSHGDWVSFDDYEKLEAAIDMLEKQRASTAVLSDWSLAMSNQCTCTTDKEATCIVHPTTRSLKDHIAELREELRNSWRPIETAPRDTRILLQGAHGDMADGWWVGSGWSWPYINKEPLYWRALLPTWRV